MQRGSASEGNGRVPREESSLRCFREADSWRSELFKKSTRFVKYFIFQARSKYLENHGHFVFHTKMSTFFLSIIDCSTKTFQISTHPKQLYQKNIVCGCFGFFIVVLILRLPSLKMELLFCTQIFLSKKFRPARRSWSFITSAAWRI